MQKLLKHQVTDQITRDVIPKKYNRKRKKEAPAAGAKEKNKKEKKMMKKIGAIVLALVMVLVMVSTAFAADNDGDTGSDGIAGNTSGKWTAEDTPVVQTDKIAIIYKEIKAYNPDDCTINAPTISYSYTVTAGDSGKEIYDNKANHDPAANAHAFTKAGIVNGISVNESGSATGTVSWSPSNDTLSASSEGVKNTKTINIDFSEVVFTGAGVYRYVITETATRFGTSGVVDGDNIAKSVRYLDVYVMDGSGTDAAAYDIYGFVCFCNNNSIDDRDTPTLSTVAEAQKTEGFVETSGTGDKYYTYNVTIQKDLVGDQANNNHQFPFKVVFANTTVTDAVLPNVSGTGIYTAPTLTAGALTSFTVDGISTTAAQQLKIADDGTVTFTGIPAGTTLTIDEYNDVTGTIYTTTTENGTTNETDGVTLTWSAWASAQSGWNTVTALKETANENTAASNNVTVKFINTLLTISPTGVILRIAPYALILAAGIALLLISRRRKAEEE